MYRGSYIPVPDFRGGYCGNLPATSLSLNQAADLDNLVLLPNGLGFRSRLGNSKANASALNSGANVQGIGYFLLSSGTDYLVVVCGTKFYKDVSGTFTDITGSVTITDGVNNKWDFVTFNDKTIGFGGPPSSPDAPFTWTGSGNAAALGGTAPSAYGAFTANNRVFAFRTSASPSTIYWSIIADATDWTGAGSGSATVGSLNDNQKITAALVLNTNYVLVFKDTSTYQMVISSAPFPIYTLFDKVGCVGKKAAVNVDGTVYFVNSRKRMLSTDGEGVKEYPNTADDLWNAVDSSTLPYTEGFRQKGADYDWLVWIVTISSTKRAIIWDLLNHCWLRCTTGYKMNTAGIYNNGLVALGGTDGFVYLPDQSAVYADASESSPGTITSYWRSGWLNGGQFENIMQIRRLTAQYKTKASGNITVTYGFDFVPDSANFTLSQTATGSESLTSRMHVLAGRGNFFQFKIGQSSSAIDTQVNSLVLSGKTYGQKRISAP